MNANLPNSTILTIMFKRLRKEEGIDGGKLFSMVDPTLAYAILLNARCKQEKQQALTNLEEELRREAGNYIRMYVAEKWEKVKMEQGAALPFPELATKTISDVMQAKKFA